MRGAAGRAVAQRVMQDFATMFPASKLLPAEKQYLMALVAHQINEALRSDDGGWFDEETGFRDD
jgi:hypothetical protein